MNQLRKSCASGMESGLIYLWDTNTGKQKKILRGHTRGLQRLTLNDQTRTLTSQSRDGTVLLWDISSITETTDNTK